MLSSASHAYPPTLDFDNLPSPKDKSGISPMKAYGQAKLCNALMAVELQKRYGDQGLHACSVHPGNMVTTSFGDESTLLKIAFKLASPFTKNANQGASTTVMCASHEPASDLAGQYFAHCKPEKCSAEAKNPQVAAKLWSLTEDWIDSAA